MILHTSISSDQGTHGTGKTGKMAQKEIWKCCQYTGNFVKTHGILLAQVVNILKVKNIAIFAAKKIPFFQKLDIIGLPSQFCVCNSHKLCNLAQGKFAVGQGKYREFKNTI